MDLKTLTNMFPSHKLVMGEQFAQENISALKVKTILNWSDTIFVNCDFSEAHFHLLMVSGAIFFQCDFAGSTMRACDVDACEFISCNLTRMNMLGSAVTDTSFTDCIIGGFMGPANFQCCSFVYPRYARDIPITSPYPYVKLTTFTEPLFIYRTSHSWHVHSGGSVKNVAVSEVGSANKIMKEAILFAEASLKLSAVHQHIELAETA